MSKQKMDIRDRIEQQFGRWGLFITLHPWLIIFICLLAIVGAATQISKIYIDTSNEVFLHEDDPIRVTYNDFRNQFGREERAVLIVDSTDSIFTFENLERLRALHKQLENELPKIQEVLSLYNARLTIGNGDELIVKDLLEDWPKSQQDLNALKQLVMNHPIYRDQFIGIDDKTQLILIQTDAYSSIQNSSDETSIDDTLSGFDDSNSQSLRSQLLNNEVKSPPFLTGEENNEIVSAIDEIIAQHYQRDFQITASGTPHMNTILTNILMTDMSRFTISSLIAIALVLALLFRRFVMIFVPLTIALLGVIVTFSLMAAIGIPFTVITQIIPSFLLAVGVGNSVHIFAVFFQHLQQTSNKQKALIYALQHSGFAIAMTALTTAGGLLSFSTAEIKPISDFGIVSAIGIISVLLLSVTLLPALIAILPIKKRQNIQPDNQLNQRLLNYCAHLAANKPWHIVIISGILVISALLSASQLRPTHDPMKWFQPDHPFRMATDRVNDEFGGAIFLEVIVDTQKENGLHNPELLRRIEKVHQAAYRFEANDIRFKKAFSIIDINKELHQALNQNLPAFYALPNDTPLIAQELLLFENTGSDDLEQMTDSLFSKARITLRAPMVEATRYAEIERQFYKEVRGIIGDMAKVEFTGLLAIDIQTTPAMVQSLVNSYLLAFLVITPLMMILLGSFSTGLMSMIPNLTPIVITLGIMQIANIPLEAFTLLIGCIALGLAVDDTIHFMHNFQRFYRHNGDAELSVQKSLRSTGQAILFTTIVLTLAFYTYMMSSMSNLIYFGLLTGSCILLAFLADVLLAPALVILKARYEEGHNNK